MNRKKSGASMKTKWTCPLWKKPYTRFSNSYIRKLPSFYGISDFFLQRREFASVWCMRIYQNATIISFLKSYLNAIIDCSITGNERFECLRDNFFIVLRKQNLLPVQFFRDMLQRFCLLASVSIPYRLQQNDGKLFRIEGIKKDTSVWILFAVDRDV